MDAERRHIWAGARDRVLRAHGAVAPPYETARQPANFRSSSLIIPPSLAGDAKTMSAIRTKVRKAGLAITTRSPSGRPTGAPTVARVWHDPVNGNPVAAASTAIHAIQTVPELRGVSHDRLLMGCAMVGEGPPTAGHSDPGEGGYPNLWPERGGRVPVMLPKPPPLTAPDELLGFRSVIAVLDSGFGKNAWLDIDKDGNPADNRFLVADEAIQGEIRRIMISNGRRTPGLQILRNGRDASWSGNRRLRDIDSHLGHGTFITGIMRPRAPEAMIRMIRVMYSDGIVYESAAVAALWELHRRIVAAADRSDVVDVVSLSFGGFFREEAEEREDSPLFWAINALREQGVIVVAAAGNAATSEPFFPAAMADTSDPGLVPVVSVGALNPNGKKAAFSNYGDWVNHDAPGVSIISAMPDDIQGPMNPAYVYQLPRRETAHTLDPDDFMSGHAIWSGTSFATAFAAADIARRLAEIRRETGDLDMSVDRRKERARRVLTEIGVPW